MANPRPAKATARTPPSRKNRPKFMNRTKELQFHQRGPQKNGKLAPYMTSAAWAEVRADRRQVRQRRDRYAARATADSPAHEI